MAETQTSSDDVALEVEAGPSGDAVVTQAPEGDFAPKKGLGIGFWLSAVWMIVLVVLAALAPWLPFVDDPEAIDFSVPEKQGPTAGNWFGTDSIGRDIFSRVVYGGRVSLFIAGVVLVLGFVFGGTLGITAGYFRGRFDRIASAVMDVLLAFPALVLALALIGIFTEAQSSPGIIVVILALSILSVAPLGRITRGATLSVAEREFVTAARTLGAKNARIIRKEILPNVIPPMAAFALTVIAIIIVAEGALAFLGLSVSSPAVTWGRLISDGRDELENAPHIALMPSAVMFLTILALNYMGDVLAARFSVREGAL